MFKFVQNDHLTRWVTSFKGILPSLPHCILEQPQRQWVKSKSQISPFSLYFDQILFLGENNIFKFSNILRSVLVYFDADSWIVLYTRPLVFQGNNSIVKKSNFFTKIHFFVVHLQIWNINNSIFKGSRFAKFSFRNFSNVLKNSKLGPFYWIDPSSVQRRVPESVVGYQHR